MAKITKEHIKGLQQELLKIDPDNDEYKIDDITAEHYLKVNHNNSLDAINHIIVEKFLKVKEEQPSPKRQRSKKRESPSPSSIMVPYKESDPDLAQALANSLMGEQFIKREAQSFSFAEWITRLTDGLAVKLAPYQESTLRQKLKYLFNELTDGWTVTDPAPDGFCGLYVAAIDFQNKPDADAQVLARAQEVTRDGLTEFILDGMKKYYEAQCRHNGLGIPLPPELNDGPTGKYVNIDDRVDEEGNVNTYFYLTHKNLLTHEEEIRKKLKVLERLSNTPEALFIYLPYIYKRNYLILTYDDNSPINPFVTTFMPCYADVELDEHGTITYPHNTYKNCAVMFNNRHYFLLDNPSTVITEFIVDYVLKNKENTKNNKAMPNDEKVWHGFTLQPTASGRVRKLKSRKQNYRIQQSKKRKTRKQHYRKQKSRKQQPKKQKNKTKTNYK